LRSNFPKEANRFRLDGALITKSRKESKAQIKQSLRLFKSFYRTDITGVRQCGNKAILEDASGIAL